MTAAVRRPYDATRRRARGERQRQDTRARVLDAATTLFTTRGYTATTVAAIAARARVSPQTVYLAVGGKADLLRASAAAAVTGAGPSASVLDQPWVAALAAERDGRRQVAMLVRGSVDLAERAAPLWRALAEAAAHDEVLAADLREHDAGRRRDQRTIVAHVRGLVMLPGRAADVLEALVSPDAWHLLTVERGWSRDDVETVLLRALTAALLGAAADGPRTAT